ncbi:MAG: endonuclease V [Candidatus Hodarchaeota archaeon]
MKIKIFERKAYSGLFIYDYKKNMIINSYFEMQEAKISEYLPSVLFLTQTDIYLNLVENVEEEPDCYIVNSSGQVHPFLYGAACDFGLKIETPVIGYTKKLLYGVLKIYDEKTNIHGIFSNNLLIGFAIPKPNSNKFYYISIGNNISLQTALKLFLELDLSVINMLNTKLNNFILNKTKKKT